MVNTPLIPYMCFRIKFIENIDVNLAYGAWLGLGRCTESSGSCWERAWGMWGRGNAELPKALLSHPALASPLPSLGKKGYLIIAGYLKSRRKEGGEKGKKL